MYKQSFFLVVLSLIVMGMLFAGTKMVAAIPGFSGLPSSYDPKIKVETAVKTSQNPLLIEFYTDTCRTCRIITPWIYKLGKKYENELTFVMVDVNNPAHAQIANIFGIEYVPAIFVFDFKHMAKAQIEPESYGNIDAIERSLIKAKRKVKKAAQQKS